LKEEADTPSFSSRGFSPFTLVPTKLIYRFCYELILITALNLWDSFPSFSLPYLPPPPVQHINAWHGMSLEEVLEVF
jgi:hypothetical protein